MSKESSFHTPRRTSTALAILTAGFLVGGIQRAPDVSFPSAPLERLQDESARLGNEREGFTYEVAHYLARHNREGGNVAPAIRQLEDPKIQPDLVEEQLYFFLGMSHRGGDLSPEERRAVAEVAKSWPDHFEPYFTTDHEHPDTRAELIHQLRASNPPLDRYLPEEDPDQEIASRDH